MHTSVGKIGFGFSSELVHLMIYFCSYAFSLACFQYTIYIKTIQVNFVGVLGTHTQMETGELWGREGLSITADPIIINKV
jgi:hypothetical protein